jgi:hypothetical protein
MLASLVFYSLAVAQDSTYYKAPAFTPPAVAWIKVDKPSQKSAAGADENCSNFMMTPELSQEFFRHARAVSEQRRMHELDWSACYAEGRVKFVDGQRGSWMIARYGVGALTLSSGRFKGETVFLHCARCEEWNR